MISIVKNQPKNQYLPDYVSPPGETLLELLGDRGMSQADLADRTGRPKKTINEIIHGKAAITHDTALQLERVLSIPANNTTVSSWHGSKSRRICNNRLLGSIAFLSMKW